jgi:hypothetical protein
MTIKEFLEQVEELDRMLLEEVDLELTDYARAQAHFAIDHIREVVTENEDVENY